MPQAEYIANKEKQRLQQMLDQFRKQVQHSEVELEALRGALVRCEGQTVKDKDEIERLTRAIDQMTIQVSNTCACLCVCIHVCMMVPEFFLFEYSCIVIMH